MVGQQKRYRHDFCPLDSRFNEHSMLVPTTGSCETLILVTVDSTCTSISTRACM